MFNTFIINKFVLSTIINLLSLIISMFFYFSLLFSFYLYSLMDLWQ